MVDLMKQRNCWCTETNFYYCKEYLLDLQNQTNIFMHACISFTQIVSCKCSSGEKPRTIYNWNETFVNKNLHSVVLNSSKLRFAAKLSFWSDVIKIFCNKLVKIANRMFGEETLAHELPYKQRNFGTSQLGQFLSSLVEQILLLSMFYILNHTAIWCNLFSGSEVYSWQC